MRIKYVFKLAFTLFCVAFALVSCGVNDTKKALNSDAKIIESGDIVFDGLNGKDTVANSEKVYRFNDEITVSPKARWVLSKDQYGSENIATKIAPLDIGDNKFYIVVTSGDETKIEVFTVVIRRKPIYTVSFNTNGGSSVSSQYIEEGYNLENVAKPSKEGYTFDGWYIGEEKVKLPYTVTSDLSIKAKFTAQIDTNYVVKHYKQNIDGTYNTIPDDIDNLTGTTNTSTKASLKNYEGFTSPGLTQTTIKGDGSTVIELKYIRNSYTVTTSVNNTSAGSVTSSKSYEYGENVSLTATAYLGYTFEGWYNESTKVSSNSTYTFAMPANDRTLEAKFTANKYSVTIDPQGYNYTGKTTYEVTYGETFEFPVASGTFADKVYTTTTTTFKGWKYNGEYITDTNGNLLNDWNITSNITITPEIVADGMYFGIYPQTKVEASSLNGLSSITFNESTWNDYGYYISGNVESYMYYYDIDTDNNGTYDYRGVYFTSYRPYVTNYGSYTSLSYQDDKGYNTNTIYWFKYEPIKWNALESKDGKALILADLILDSQDYNYTDGIKIIDGNTVYNNYYELSHIRQWLNDTFYETAFNELEKAIIETTNVDNSVSSTGIMSTHNPYTNTNDKIFLLSYQEADKYFTDNTSRQAKPTDYAQAQGATTSTNSSYLGNGYWWLRSPRDHYDYHEYYACYVYYDGNIDYRNGRVNYTYHGVRPACWITL